MSDRMRVGMLGGAAAAGVAALLLPWRRVDALFAEVRLGLREGAICTAGECEVRPPPGWLLPLGYIVSGICVGVALLALARIATILTRRDSARLALATRLAGLAMFASTVVVIVAHGEPYHSGLSWGLFAALAAGLLALLGSAAEEATRETSVVREGRVADRGPAPSPEVSIRRAAMELTSAAARPRQGLTNPDATANKLRFVVNAATLDADAITVGDRRIAYCELVRVHARHFPPDPPFEKALFVDLVPATGEPLRLLATSRLNYTQLPGGAAPTAKQNLRRLVQLMHAKCPTAELDEGTAAFAAGKDAPVLGSFRQFAEYDASYSS